MAATISGTVFNDINHNGIYDPGTDTGISGAYVVLENVTAGTCVDVQSDNTGAYSFTNITTAGVYTIYETVTTPDACPPTIFTQPSGLNDSTTARQLSITVTSTQITNNTNISGNNFGHDSNTTFGCQPYAWQVAGGGASVTSTLNKIDLATGSDVSQGNVSPNVLLNGIGYNATDGNIYGWGNNTIQRLTPNRQALAFASVPNLPVAGYNAGDVSPDGYLYLYTASATSFFTIDVNPNRATFLQIVDPTNGYVLKTAAPFGTAVSATINTGDLAVNPNDGNLYAVDNSTGRVTRIVPTTGTTTVFTTTPIISGSFGGAFFDDFNNLYALDNNAPGNINKYVLSGTTATASTIASTGIATSSNDGARCPTAPINFATITPSKSATPYVGVGDTINYTIILNNTGNETALNVILIDTIPNGAIFSPNSVFLDGSLVSGNPEPPTGVDLGTLKLGVHTVTFNVVTTTVPSPNPTPNIASGSFNFIDGSPPNTFTSGFNTNIASTTINYAVLNSSKIVNKVFANVGDILTYTIAYTNLGNTTAINLVLIDTIPIGTTFVSGSLKQDGGSISGSPTPPGITLPTGILAGKTSTVTFNVKVASTIPSPNPIVNDSSTKYSNIGNPSIPTTQSSSISSNNVSTIINAADLSGMTKSVDKSFATCSDIITYTIVVSNSGNTTAVNVIIKDTLPNGTTFVTNSVTINGITQTGANPSLGVTIPSIASGATATLTFQATVQC